MESLSERLKISLEQSGKTKTDIWRTCKISSGAVSQWFSGATKKLEGENLLCAARVLGVDPDWLATGKGTKAPKSQRLSAEEPPAEYGNIGEKMPLGWRVPLISYVAAGNWSEIMDWNQPGVAEDWIETTYKAKRSTYALRVRGDSMVNTGGGKYSFPEGAVIIVEPEELPKNGSFVIVRQNGSEATFKQLVIDGGQKFLKPLNDRYPIMPMQEDAVMCGVVKQMVMDI